MLSTVRFATVSLDVDSTLSGIEGIDWLADRRGARVAARVHALTERAMRGDVALESVYAHRLAIVRPSATDVEALGAAYVETLAPGAAESVGALRAAGVRVVVVSGGIRQALVPLVRVLGVAEEDLHGVALEFGGDGRYAGFDSESPLARAGGKRTLFDSLAPVLPQPIVHVGDGATDLEVVQSGGGVPVALVAFTGFARRPAVVAGADAEVGSFPELRALVLGGVIG
jgi:phosphoserine phosphatase